jgi:hypothetical protein
MSDHAAEDDGSPAAAAARPRPLGERTALWLALAALAAVVLLTAVTFVHILAQRY